MARIQSILLSFTMRSFGVVPDLGVTGTTMLEIVADPLSTGSVMGSNLACGDDAVKTFVERYNPPPLVPA
ncbi:hypothetical protein [Salinicola tamaricis]|uniref:hypothetical protein n=1 Tax=Salinicola tamaricis TaxID=1771309 RepID=UPI0013EACAA3|nr:hypothetical protein [Salinicola tamaricis]